MNSDPDAPKGFDERLSQRAKAKDSDNRLQYPLEMNDVNPGSYYGGKLPNTPLVVSIISFFLGGVCLLGFSLFVTGGHAGSVVDHMAIWVLRAVVGVLSLGRVCCYGRME